MDVFNRMELYDIAVLKEEQMICVMTPNVRSTYARTDGFTTPLFWWGSLLDGMRSFVQKMHFPMMAAGVVLGLCTSL